MAKMSTRGFVAGVAALGLLMLAACEPEDIVNSDIYYAAASPANGIRVYLSSPRHASSGSRGECTNPGWEENINGRAWNYYAATGEYAQDVYDPTSPYRNLASRGYAVTVSENTRDDGYLANRSSSDNWGADIHIVSHTNAAGGCDNATQYTLGSWKEGDTALGEPLARRLTTVVDNVAPGGKNNWCRGPNCPQGSLAELSAAAPRRAYMELIFHTSQASQSWFKGTGNADRGSQRYAWRYGAAVDNELGYP